ncbi:MAG: alanine racemase [Candidatus Izemoplasmataceae bacterium]
MYPKLTINLNKFKHNLNTLNSLLESFGITMMAVTKVFCADQPLIDVINDSSVKYIADSRIQNLKSMKTSKKRVLLRLPSINNLDEVVLNSEISLNSELVTIEALNETAKKYQKTHEIIIMIDIGDLREGIYYKETIIETIKKIKSLKYIDLVGIGTNLTCFGGIIPEKETLKKLIDIIKTIKTTLNVEFNIVSGGNSSHLHLINSGEKVPYINNLRIGEALVLGRETSYGKQINDLYKDIFTLEADLIEVKLKPSIPEGRIGMNAFGETPIFSDLGLMKRGIIALGRQDVDFHEIIPVDESIRLIGSSSDHIIVDLTHASLDYQVGDRLLFNVTYGSLLSLMTSKYVTKTYL